MTDEDDDAPAPSWRQRPKPVGFEIGQESADVVTLTVSPLPAGRARLATALADGRGLNYSLTGTLQAAPLDGSSRDYKIKRDSALSPVPGLPGVLR